MKAKAIPVNLTAVWADELGQIQAELAPVRGKITREEKLKKLLREQADTDGIAATVGTFYRGAEFTASVGERAEERNFELLKVYRASKMKPAEFLALCSMTLKNVEKVLSDEQQKELITKAATGSRKVTTYANPVA